MKCLESSWPLLLTLVVWTGCKQGGASPEPEPPPAPASQPASAPASQPASAPAKLEVTFSRTASLSTDRLRTHVVALASDEMKGRGPDSDGIDLAADYIEKTFREAGLAPGFAESFRQPFEMKVRTHVRRPTMLDHGRRRVRLGKDFAPFVFSASGTVEGDVLFIGFGVKAEKLGYDDFAGHDLKGKIVVALTGEPGDDDPKSAFDGKKRTKHSSLHRKVILAREAGALALLMIRDKVDVQKTFSDPQSDSGLMAAGISIGLSDRLLGFSTAEAKKSIDDAHKPNSRPGKGKVKLSITLEHEKRNVDNLGAVIMADPPSDEWVVLGAHYDHLGFGGSGSLSGSKKPVIHNGADDNASGTAVVMEVARALKGRSTPMNRNAAFLLFAGEERGLLGSSYFVKSKHIATEKVAAMINLDMVGHLRSKKMNVMGVKTALEFEELATRAVHGRALKGSFGGDGYGPSDHTSFYAAGAPVMFLFTGAHTHYHKPSDDPQTLNYGGMAQVGAVAADLVEALSTANERPTYVRAPRPKPIGDGRGYGPYFGSIPDFGEQEGGVLFAGVREGSPAAKAGVTKGDVLVEFGGIAVKNLRDFTMALREHAPGDEVEVVIQRGKERKTFKVTLGRRN